MREVFFGLEDEPIGVRHYDGRADPSVKPGEEDVDFFPDLKPRTKEGAQASSPSVPHVAQELTSLVCELPQGTPEPPAAPPNL